MTAALIAGISTATPAQADPVWQRQPQIGLNVGLSLVANLGPLDDRKRFGVALDGGWQAMWWEGKVGYDGPSPISPLARISAHWGWTQPVVFAEVAAQAGVVLPLSVHDRGFVPAAGLIAGGGLGMATDGWAGPLLTGTAIGPLIEGRAEVARREGWHAPRLHIGLALPANCCSTELTLRGSTVGTVPPVSPGPTTTTTTTTARQLGTP